MITEQLGANLSNGVKRIQRHGLVTFAIGDDPEFKFDVVAAYDNWVVIQATYLVDGPDGKTVPKEKQLAFNQERLQFVQGLVNAAYGQQLTGKEPPVLTHAEAITFLANVSEEVERLQSFFAPKSQSPPASRANMDIRFEQ